MRFYQCQHFEQKYFSLFHVPNVCSALSSRFAALASKISCAGFHASVSYTDGFDIAVVVLNPQVRDIVILYPIFCQVKYKEKRVNSIPGSVIKTSFIISRI